MGWADDFYYHGHRLFSGGLHKNHPPHPGPYRTKEEADIWAADIRARLWCWTECLVKDLPDHRALPEPDFVSLAKNKA